MKDENPLIGLSKREVVKILEEWAEEVAKRKLKERKKDTEKGVYSAC